MSKKQASKTLNNIPDFEANKQPSQQTGTLSVVPPPHAGHQGRKASNALFGRKINQAEDFTGKVMTKYGLERIDLEMINFNFKKQDVADSGKLQFHQLLIILKNMQFTVDESVKKLIFKELEDRGLKQLELETVFLIVGVLRQKEQRLIEDGDEENQNEFIDAFVALGGNPDSTGKIMKATMLKIIKEEFDLSFDMEKIMERIEASSDELDYQTFCMLFENPNEDRKRRNSRASTILSQFSQKSKKSSRTVASVKIRYQDFEKFCQDFTE